MTATESCAAFVKLRFENERRFYFMVGDGSVTSKRLHAAMVWDHAKARESAEWVVANNDNVSAAVVTVGGRIVHRVGEATPPKPPNPYGPANGYRWLVDATPAGYAVCHVKRADGAWAHADWETVEACFDEANRAGLSKVRVHGATCGMSMSRGLRFVQESNR